MFILLDLIGDKDTQFVNLFHVATGKYYNRLQEIGKLKDRAYSKQRPAGQSRAIAHAYATSPGLAWSAGL